VTAVMESSSLGFPEGLLSVFQVNMKELEQVVKRQEGHGWRNKHLREEIAVRSGVQRRRNWFSQDRMGGFE